MVSEEYLEKMSWNFFGEYKDNDVKKDTICFRVSKKAKNYFTQHANGAYGSTQKAMEIIFKEYMESIVYKRGKVYGTAVLLIPKFNSKKELKNIGPEDIIDFDDDCFWSENDLDYKSIHFEDNIVEDVIVDSHYSSKGISSYDSYYFNENLEIDGYDVDIDNYIVVPFYLNNYLDSFKDGVYRAIGGYGHIG